MASASTKLITASFTVSGRDLDDQSALGICRLLQAVTEQTDAALVRTTGTLDYNKTRLTHYHLDIVGSARLGDTVLLHTYISSDDERGLALELRGVRKRGRAETPLLNGSFVYLRHQTAAVAGG